MFLSFEQSSTALRRVPWGAWFEGGSEGDSSGDPNAGTGDPTSYGDGSSSTDTSGSSSTDTFGGGDTSTDTSGGGGSTDTSGGGGSYSYDPFGGISSTGVIAGGNTGDSAGTSGWFNTNTGQMGGGSPDNTSGLTVNSPGDIGSQDYMGNTLHDGETAAQAFANGPGDPAYDFFASFDGGFYTGAGAAGTDLFGPGSLGFPGAYGGSGNQQGGGGGGGGGTVYYNPTTGQTSATQTPGSVPVRSPVAPGGTVPIMNTQFEVAKLQAATDAARLAYDYWHSISGSDQLAFEKAQLAAQTAYQQGQLAIGQGQVGVAALKVAGDLSANPFRQQQTLWGIGANPYLSAAVGGVAGQYDLPKFQGAGVSSAGSNTLSDLAGRMGGADTSNANGTQADFQSAVNAMPNPNQVVARNFYQADPATQAYIVSGIQAKTGLDPNVITDQIKATLPSFKSPSFGLADI